MNIIRTAERQVWQLRWPLACSRRCASRLAARNAARRRERLAQSLWSAHPLQPSLRPAVEVAWARTIGDWRQRLAAAPIGAKTVGGTNGRGTVESSPCINAHVHATFRFHLVDVIRAISDVWRAGDRSMNERDVVHVQHPILSFNCATSGAVGVNDMLLRMRRYRCAPGAFLLHNGVTIDNRTQAPVAHTVDQRRALECVRLNAFSQRFYWHEGYQLLIVFDPAQSVLHSARFGWLDSDDWFEVPKHATAKNAFAIVEERDLKSTTVLLK